MWMKYSLSLRTPHFPPSECTEGRVAACSKIVSTFHFKHSGFGHFFALFLCSLFDSLSKDLVCGQDDNSFSFKSSKRSHLSLLGSVVYISLHELACNKINKNIASIIMWYRIKCGGHRVGSTSLDCSSCCLGMAGPGLGHTYLLVVWRSEVTPAKQYITYNISHQQWKQGKGANKNTLIAKFSLMLS